MQRYYVFATRDSVLRFPSYFHWDGTRVFVLLLATEFYDTLYERLVTSGGLILVNVSPLLQRALILR